MMTDDPAGAVLVAEVVPTSRRGVAIGLVFIILLGLSVVVLQQSDVPIISNESGAQDSSSSDWRPYSVVAPIDTGINVYHDHFRTDEI